MAIVGRSGTQGRRRRVRHPWSDRTDRLVVLLLDVEDGDHDLVGDRFALLLEPTDHPRHGLVSLSLSLFLGTFEGVADVVGTALAEAAAAAGGRSERGERSDVVVGRR